MLSDNPHYPHSQSTKAVMLFVALPPPKRQSLTQRHSNTRQKCKSTTLNGQKEMVTTRVELATLALLAPRSNQLTGWMLVTVGSNDVLNELTLSDRVDSLMERISSNNNIVKVEKRKQRWPSAETVFGIVGGGDSGRLNSES
jgi:hypothetical protein